MNDNLLKTLPKAVSERFSDSPDTFFDTDKSVIELRAAHASTRQAFNEANAELNKVRSAIASANESAETARQHLADLVAQRGEALAREFLDGGLFEDDDRMLDEIHALRTTIERVTLAGPVLERIRRERNREVEIAFDRDYDAIQKISDRIDELRLTEAYCRAPVFDAEEAPREKERS